MPHKRQTRGSIYKQDSRRAQARAAVAKVTGKAVAKTAAPQHASKLAKQIADENIPEAVLKGKKKAK